MDGNLLKKNLSDYTSIEIIELIRKGEIPRIADETIPIRFLCDCGKKSIYVRVILVHKAYLRYEPKTLFLCGDCNNGGED